LSQFQIVVNSSDELIGSRHQGKVNKMHQPQEACRFIYVLSSLFILNNGDVDVKVKNAALYFLIPLIFSSSEIATIKEPTCSNTYYKKDKIYQCIDS